MQTTRSSTLIVFGLIQVISINGFLDTDLIKAYYRAKFLKRGIVYGCNGNVEHVAVMKDLMALTGMFTISHLSIDKLCKSTGYNHVGVVVDMNCTDAPSFLIQCGENNLFDVRHHWLIFSTKDEDVTKVFENVKIFINADIQMAYPSKNKYIIEDLYNPAHGKGGTVQRRILGSYNRSYGYDVAEKSNKYEMRRNMTGVTLKSIIVLPESYEGTLQEYLSSERDRQINTFNRFHYNIFRNCKKYYNFTEEISVSKSWGYLTKAGDFDGMVGALQKKLIDYGSSPLFVRTDRAQVMEYGRRTWILRAAFIFRNPKSRRSVDIFIKPLSMSIWLLTMVSAISVIIVLKVGHVFEKENVRRNAEASWSYLVISTIGVFCQQGITSTPSFISGRITTFCLLLLSLIIYQFYSASLVSHLLMQPRTSIKTIADILMSHMRVGCQDILYNRDYFLYTNDKPSRELYRRKILKKGLNTSNFLDPVKGVDLVNRGDYAFHVELATAYPIIQNTFSDKAICELREVQMYRTQPMHANYQKHSPFRDMFETCFQCQAEYGILKRELIFWHPKKPSCIAAGRQVSIGLDYFYPVLMFLGIGTILSVLILCVEIYVDFECETHNRSKLDTAYPFVN